MNVLVIGLGSMGKRRVRNLQALGVKNITGFDPRADRAQQAQEKYGIATACDFAALQPDAFDRAVISTPPESHMHYAHWAADHRIPCFIEASVVDADMPRLIERHRQDPALLACPSCTFAFHPAIREIARLLQEKAVGTLSNFSYHSGQYLPDWHPWERIQDFYVSNRATGGCREIVPFELAWLNKLFGGVRRAGGFHAKTIALDADIDDTYAFSLQYESGMLGSVVIDVVSRISTRRLLINGEEGQIRWDWDAAHIELYQPRAQAFTAIPVKAGHAQEGYYPGIIEEMYVAELDAFLQAADGGRPFPNTLEQDYSLLQLLYSIEKSDREG